MLFTKDRKVLENSAGEFSGSHVDGHYKILSDLVSSAYPVLNIGSQTPRYRYAQPLALPSRRHVS